MMLKNEETTTIQLTTGTVEKLVELKQHPRETYEDVITRLIEQNKQLMERFEKDFQDPDFDDTGLDGCKPGESIRKQEAA